jgi:hypothetical protein
MKVASSDKNSLDKTKKGIGSFGSAVTSSNGAASSDSAPAAAAAAAAAASAAALALAVPEQARKIFVGGLAPSVTDADFRAYFEKFGPIVDAVVMFDRQTQRSRGFGFITFEAEASLDGVFEVSDRHDFKGKTVEVKRAEPKEQTAARHAAIAHHSSKLEEGGEGGGLLHVGPPTPAQQAAAAAAAAQAAAMAAAAAQRALDDAAGLTLAQRLARDLEIEKKGKAPPAAAAAAAAAPHESQATGGGEQAAEEGYDDGWHQSDTSADGSSSNGDQGGRIRAFAALSLQEQVPVPGMGVGTGGHGVRFGKLHPPGVSGKFQTEHNTVLLVLNPQPS